MYIIDGGYNIVMTAQNQDNLLIYLVYSYPTMDVILYVFFAVFSDPPLLYFTGTSVVLRVVFLYLSQLFFEGGTPQNCIAVTVSFYPLAHVVYFLVNSPSMTLF